MGLVALCLLPLQAASQSGPSPRLSGKITNEATGAPLVGATVFVPDVKMGAVSDGKGHYTISGLPKGRFLVEVRYAGFSTRSATLQLNGTVQKDWTLAPAVIEGREVVITGVSKATEVSRQPAHISVLNHLELQQKTTDNIIGKIADMPGVSAVTTGPNVMKPVVRGLSSNRIVVVNNGIRQEGQQWGAEHGIEVDAYSAGSIEVLRGAASLMYGSDALGGVVNILPPDPAPQGHIQGELAANYQTNNGLIAAHGDIKGNENGLTWQAYGTLKQAHDYQNRYDGYVFNSKFKERNFGGGLGLNRSWGYSHLSFSSYDLSIGLPEGERDETTGKFLKETVIDGKAEEAVATTDDFKSYQPYIGKQRVQHQKLTMDNKFLLGSGSLDVTLAWQQNRRREFEDVLAPEEPGLFLKLNTLNLNARYGFAERAGWHITVGANGMVQKNTNQGAEFLIPDYRMLDLGLYGVAQKTLQRFTFTGGLRADGRFLHSDALNEGGEMLFVDFDKDFSNLSGSLGLAYQAGQHIVLKANIARGFRAPSIPELSANGVHEGTIRYETGALDLKPEVSLEVDAGATYESEHVSASLYGYLNTIDHYIYSRKLLNQQGGDSLRHTEEGDFQVFRYEQTRARLYGLEASVDLHPHPLDWLHFKNTFSWVRGQRVNGPDSTRDLPFIPAGRLISELGFRFNHTGPVFHSVFFNIKMNNTFAQNHFMRAYRTETATPAYTLLDLEAGANVNNSKGKTLFKLFLSAENVTDVAYQDHLSRLKYLPENMVSGRYGIFNMGRNFSFKVIVPFDFQ